MILGLMLVVLIGSFVLNYVFWVDGWTFRYYIAYSFTGAGIVFALIISILIVILRLKG